MASPRINESAWRARSKSIALLRAATTSASIYSCLSASLPLLASSKMESAREELVEGLDGGGSGPYLGGGGGGDES